MYYKLILTTIYLLQKYDYFYSNENLTIIV